MAKKEVKPFLLRIDPAVLAAVLRWAEEDLRSLYGQRHRPPRKLRRLPKMKRLQRRKANRSPLLQSLTKRPRNFLVQRRPQKLSLDLRLSLLLLRTRPKKLSRRARLRIARPGQRRLQPLRMTRRKNY